MDNRVLTATSQQRAVEDRQSSFSGSGWRWTILALSWLIAMSIGAYLARQNAIAVAGIFTPVPATVLAAAQVMKVRQQMLTIDNNHARPASAETDDEAGQTNSSKSSTK